VVATVKQVLIEITKDSTLAGVGKSFGTSIEYEEIRTKVKLNY
jgi:hypothetical protein